MNQFFPEKIAGKPRILVAPLDWGLGHATRCIPVIRELLKQGTEVWLAGEGAQKELLKAEFPALPFLNLPGYRIQYARTARAFIWKIIKQIPGLKKAIRTEHEWLKKAAAGYRFDAVISDNRYGLYHSSIPCIFITHQLQIKSSAGKWTEKILQRKNYRYINRFAECWVPDNEGPDNFASELSHPAIMPAIPVKYTGALSRFIRNDITEIKKHLLIILSGPEPQRTLLENIIVNNISHYNGTATVVRGLPASSNLIPSTRMIKFYNHLPADEFNNEMMASEYIISRSGYSTLMDALTLGKKCIFIPTPGQTEQEYLGRHLMQKQIAFCIAQKEFSLSKTLGAVQGFSFRLPPVTNTGLLTKNVANLLARL